MQELDLTVMDNGPYTPAAWQLVLEQFEQENRIRVNMRVLSWRAGWGELVKIALFGQGADVSEIGTSWVSNLIGMKALRPFTIAEIDSVGGAAAFLPAAWSTCVIDGQVYTLPYLADTRVVCYRRDWLARVGLDPARAFGSFPDFEETLQRLHRECSLATPWVIAVSGANVLHDAAPWVWGAGGDFVSADGRRVLFADPPALAGWQAFFRLRRYLAWMASVDMRPRVDMLLGGQAAVSIFGAWVIMNYRRQYPEQIARWGSAPVPGVSFVGGVNLGLWQHSRRTEAALALVRFLMARPLATPYLTENVMLPTRLAALAVLAESADPWDQVFGAALKAGRAYPALMSWGLIEDQLIKTLTHIWAEALKDPHLEIENFLHGYLELLARRLNARLSA